MKVARATLENCSDAAGTVIVIDVLRAFTTAAFAFNAGADAITVVSTVEEAFSLREKHPSWLIMGEVKGLPVAGFDFGNSPAALLEVDLGGRHLVQRTSSGTQGVVRSRRADRLLATGLCNARATVEYLCELGVDGATMVITGSHSEGLGDEDQACADYMEALIRDQPVDVGRVVRRVRQSRTGQRFHGAQVAPFPQADLELAVDVDRFSFAMEVRRQGEKGLMRPVPSS